VGSRGLAQSRPSGESSHWRNVRGGAGLSRGCGTCVNVGGSGGGETCVNVGGIGVSGDVEIFDVGFGATNSLRRAGMVKMRVSGKRCKSREK
jgi:hypothetical protein